MSVHTIGSGEKLPKEEQYPKPKTPSPIMDKIAGRYPPGAVSQDARGEEGANNGMVREYTAWDVYNNEAKKVDRELVTDWRDSLNFLLVFAAIFAAVLTAFIIESKKMLEQDPTSLLVTIALFTTNNAGNVSNLPFILPTFEPTPVAVSINCLLFASLGSSLLAALASVVALQWVADYDAVITRGGSSSEDRAKRRQFRFDGVVWWKMSEIIAALPLLLYSSVALFWVGAIQWMWITNHTVGSIVIGGGALGALFYISTTLIATITVSAPFRTPLSRGLYWLYQAAMQKITLLLAVLALLALFISAIPLFLLLLPAFVAIPPRQGWNETWSPAISSIRTHYRGWIKARWKEKITSRQRENQASKQDPQLRDRSLAWLGEQLALSVDSHDRLLLLLREVVDEYSKRPLSKKILEAPWSAILDFLSRHYMQMIRDNTLAEDDYENFMTVLRCIRVPEIWYQIFRRDFRSISLFDEFDTDPVYASTIDGTYQEQNLFEGRELMEALVTPQENTAYLLARAPAPSGGSKYEIKATIEITKWRNAVGFKRVDIWIDIFVHTDLYSSDYLQSCIKYFQELIYGAGSRKNLRSPNLTSLWLAGQSDEEKRDRVIEALTAFDAMVKRVDNIDFHKDLIGILCSEMEGNGFRPPHPSKCPDYLIRTISKIQDPCLAILAGYACGVPAPITVAIQESYGYRHTDSFDMVQDLLYQSMAITDPAVIPKLHAPIWCSWPGQYCREVLTKPDILLVYRQPTYRRDHGPGPQHILFHLYEASRSRVQLSKDMVLFGNLDLKGEYLNPIVALLSLCDTSAWPFFKLDEDFSHDSIEQVTEICRRVKEQPAAFIELLTDITRYYSARIIWPKEMALILKLIEEATVLAEGDDTIPLLQPLKRLLLDLRARLQETKAGAAEDRKVVDMQADRICALLERKLSMRLVSQ